MRRFFVTIVILVVLLVVLDFAARVAAQSVLASKIEKQADLKAKPDVSIKGFPFLTQAASKDFQKVTIGITDLTQDSVTISKINATATSVRLNSFAGSSGTIGRVSGTALISFAELDNILAKRFGLLGSLLKGAGLNLTAAGPDEVKASLDVVGSATWRVTRLAGDRLGVQLVSSDGVKSSLLDSVANLMVRLPKLPLGLAISSVSVTSAGVVGQVSGHDVPFGSGG